MEKKSDRIKKNISKTNKYYDYDIDIDIEYRGIRNVRDLFDLSIDEDYYKPVIARGAFNSSYIQYESKGDKGKNLQINEYLNMMNSYLSDIINDHKTHGLVRYHSGNFISSKDSDETQTMNTKSNNVEIMMGSETDEIIEDLFESFFAKISRRVRKINERK